MKNIDTSDRGLVWGLDLDGRTWRDHMGSKADVLVCINKGGKNKSGNIRYTLVFRFSPDAARKIAPRTAYANAARQNHTHRVYFREDRAGSGKKLTTGSKMWSNSEIKFSLNEHEKADFDKICGSYLLLFDHEKSLYYIDWEQKLVADYE